MALTIRTPATITEYGMIEWLQAEIWGSELGIAPMHVLLTMAKESGLVLLALDDDQPIGFAYGFLALADDNRLKLASHQAGVLQTYQDQGIGYQLKLAQREAVLAKNLTQITWTFDPLQGRNARLNLSKLGAVCNTYIRNLYGDMTDALNQGLPSDRFKVDWWLTSTHVKQRLAAQRVEPELPAFEAHILNAGTILDNGILAPSAAVVSPAEAYSLVEIPADIALLKTQAPDLALQWRLQTREIFEAAFSQGYTVTDLIRRHNRNYYLLQKDWQPN